MIMHVYLSIYGFKLCDYVTFLGCKQSYNIIIQIRASYFRLHKVSRYLIAAKEFIQPGEKPP